MRAACDARVEVLRLVWQEGGYAVATKPPRPKRAPWGQRPKRRSRSELVTTLTLENAIAAPAIIGLSSPSAATGMAAVL
jgi:hypothetical protein